MSGTSFKITAKPPYRDILGRFAKASAGLQETKRPYIRKHGRRFVELAKEEAPVNTGAFRKGIRWRSFSDGSSLGFSVSDPQPLGKFIRGGTKRHPITARPGGVLSFFWVKGPRGPARYYFKSVDHPGTKPNPYIGRAYRRWLPGARADLRIVARDYSRTITGSGTKEFKA